MPPTNLFGLGYGVGPAGYGYPSVGRWSPLSLGTSLAAWYRADAGCYTDAACLFASASSQYLSKTSPTFAPTTKMTIRFSWKPTSVPGDQTLLGRWGDSQHQFLVQNSAGLIYVVIADSLTDAGANYWVSSAAALSNGTQAEIVVVYDGTLSAANRVVVYVNGSAVTGTTGGTIPAQLTVSTASLRLGTMDGAAQFANGALARLGFSSLALSGAALTAAHTSTFWADMTAARQADWFSFYNLCEASSTRVDSTGLNNLTPTNGPTVAAGPGEGLAVNNSPVKRWESQYGTNHLTQSDITKQWIWIANGQNSKPVLRNAASLAYYTFATSMFSYTGAAMVVCALKMSQADVSAYPAVIAEQSIGTSIAVCPQTFPDAGVEFSTDIFAPGGVRYGSALSTGTFYVGLWKWSNWSTHKSNGQTAIYANGVAGAVSAYGSDPTAFVSTVKSVGSFNGASGAPQLYGDLGELFVSTADPTAAVIAGANSYMNSRWAAY